MTREFLLIERAYGMVWYGMVCGENADMGSRGENRSEQNTENESHGGNI